MDKYNYSPKAYIDMLLDTLYDMAVMVYDEKIREDLLRLKIFKCRKLLDGLEVVLVKKRQ